MSIQTLVNGNNTVPTIGYTTNHKSVVYIGRGREDFYKPSFNPPSCTPGSSGVVSVEFEPPQNKKFLLRDIQWLVTVNNASGAVTSSYMWLLYFIESVKVYFDNNELKLDLSSNIKIRTALGSHLKRKYSQAELPIALECLRGATTTTMSTALSVGTSASVTHCLSLLPLFEFLDGFNISDVKKMKLEFTFRTNSNTASDLGQFISSDTTANPYTNITFSNMYLQIYLTQQENQKLYRPLSQNIILARKYNVLSTTCSWASGSETLRIRLNNDYPHLGALVQGVYLYAFNNGAVTAFNDADNMKFTQGYSAFNVTLTEDNKEILVLDTTAKKLTYKYNQSMIVNNRPPNFDPIDTSTFHLFFAPFLRVNFNLIHNSQDNCEVLQGLNNEFTDMELLITNVSALTTSVSFYSVLEYIELFKIVNGTIEKVR